VKKILIAPKTILDEVSKIVDFIRSRPLNPRLLSTFCDEMGDVYIATREDWMVITMHSLGSCIHIALRNVVIHS
jgi:hypothetical protein